MASATRSIQPLIARAGTSEFRSGRGPSVTIEFRDPTRIARAAMSPRSSRSTATSATNGRANGARLRRGAPRPARVDAQELRSFYRQMLLIRRFEEKTAEMYQRARIGGYCHLNLGEEATCVGLAAAMRPTDYLFTNYREHGYAIARGIEPELVMAELFGRQGRVAHGRGGSMHLFSAEKRLMGGYAIVGG